MSDDATFTEGATVALKSGGPTMTVGPNMVGESVDCVWFDNDGRVAATSFGTAQLKAVPDGMMVAEPPSPWLPEAERTPDEIVLASWHGSGSVRLLEYREGSDRWVEIGTGGVFPTPDLIMRIPDQDTE